MSSQCASGVGWGVLLDLQEALGRWFVSIGIQVNDSRHSFPAEYCSVGRWSSYFRYEWFKCCGWSVYTTGRTFNFNKQPKLDPKWITTPNSWQLKLSIYTSNVDSLLSKFNLYNKTHIHVDISGAQWCRDWQSRVHILCFIQLKWRDTSCSPPNFFACHSSLLPWIKPRTSTTCHSVTQMLEKKTSCHYLGGAGEEFLPLLWFPCLILHFM